MLTYPKNVTDLGITRYEKLVRLGIVGFYDYGTKLVDGIRVLGKGHSSIVFLARHEVLGDVAVKVRRADSKKDSLAKEGYLMSLDKFNVTPEVYYFDDDVVIMEYLDGSTLGKYLMSSHSCENLAKVFANLITAAYKLDLNLIDHLELTNPHKHVFVLKDLNVKFVDFESARISINPCNLCRITSYLTNLLSIDDVQTVVELLRRYKLGSKELYHEVLTTILGRTHTYCRSV